MEVRRRENEHEDNGLVDGLRQDGIISSIASEMMRERLRAETRMIERS